MIEANKIDFDFDLREPVFDDKSVSGPLLHIPYQNNLT
jgi:hypothetical protein